MNSVKKAGSIILSVILWIVILVAALYAFVTLATRDSEHLSSIAGFSPLVVESDSMVPTFEKGDMIVIKKCDPETLEVGDIITFHTIIENEYALNTHRIQEITEEYGVRNYVTKGDNNVLSDQHVIVSGDIAGKYVTRIPLLGHVIDFLSGKIGFLVVIVIPMLLFFLYQIYHLIMVIVEMKKTTAAEAAVEAESARAQELDEKTKEAERIRAEAEAALEQARKMQAEAEAALKKAKESAEQ